MSDLGQAGDAGGAARAAALPVLLRPMQADRLGPLDVRGLPDSGRQTRAAGAVAGGLSSAAPAAAAHAKLVQNGACPRAFHLYIMARSRRPEGRLRSGSDPPA